MRALWAFVYCCKKNRALATGSWIGFANVANDNHPGWPMTDQGRFEPSTKPSTFFKTGRSD